MFFMWAGLTAAHEVNIGHVPLTPASSSDAVHIRPDAETILVVLAFVIVAMYRRHYPASSPFLFSVYTKAPTRNSAGAFVEAVLNETMMDIASGHLFLTALLTISLYHGKTEKVAKKRPKNGQPPIFT